MVFTIEPMLTLGDYQWDMWADDWTVTTRDKSLTAQFEHTLVVTERGADILTTPTVAKPRNSKGSRMAKAVGIDIGGTGIKGALVDTTTGELLSDRIKLDTPEGRRAATTS